MKDELDPLTQLVASTEEIAAMPKYKFKYQRQPRTTCGSYKCNEPIFFNSKCYEHFSHYWRLRIMEIVTLKDELKKSRYRAEQYYLKFQARNEQLRGR